MMMFLPIAALIAALLLFKLTRHIARGRLITVATLFTLGLLVPASADEAPKSEAVKNLEKFGFDEKSFVDGNLYFIAYHELAHALVSEFDLPVIGREEDAADRLAIMLMTPETKDDEPEYLLGAIEGWFAAATQIELKDIPWWDEHGTDNQRAYQIACLLYGSDAKRYEKIAGSVDLPEDRRETCVGESEQNSKSWSSLIDTISLAEGAKPTAGEIPVIYNKTNDYTEDLAYLKELGLLEDISKFMADNYSFKPGIKIEAQECDGDANAFWYGEERKLIMCYELVRDFRELTKG
jgi:hypothetical protein